MIVTSYYSNKKYIYYEKMYSTIRKFLRGNYGQKKSSTPKAGETTIRKPLRYKSSQN